jgi:putative iron-regulated protein
VKQRQTIFLLLATSLALIGCERQESAPPPVVETLPLEIVDPAMDTQTQGAWLHGIGILNTSLQEARGLAEAIDRLLTDPGDANLAAARLAWQRSHDSYLEFEFFSALSGSNPGLFGVMLEYDFSIEAWPIQPGYLDYYDVYTHSGIVNDAAMPLTADALRQQHGFTDASDVSLGFHALEYLLWGEQGARPASDYTAAEPNASQSTAGVRPVDLPNNRRRSLLALLGNLLIDDLETFKQEVENPTGLLRRSYFTLQPPSRLSLLRSAGVVLLSHHRDLLLAQLDGNSGDDQASTDAGESLSHTAFAGAAASSLAHSLATVDAILLNSETGVAKWLMDDPQRWQPTTAAFTRLREKLLNWQSQPWPPTKEEGEQMVATLSQLAELMAEETQTVF